jgi:branched-chain amino acid transport system ATP-binding protein
MADALLAVSGLEAGYRQQQVLFGVDFAVRQSEVVALLGANGSGKSTVLDAVSGFVRPSAGSIRLEGAEMAGRLPHQTFRRGIIQVSQARDLFPDMSVEDNLRLGAAMRRGPVTELLAGIYAAFPRLAERRAQHVHLMSGGEQQMVAIGRALMGRPRILLLDEPSGGLAPKLVTEIAGIMLTLKARGVTMLIVEQNIKLALAVADRFLILRDGRVFERGDIGGGRIAEEEIVRSIYL